MSVPCTLVLGAGGAGGWMFHAGVVRALSAELGWTSAGLLIGTSAGSAVAAGLAHGGEIDDIVDFLDRPPTEEDIAEFRAIMADRSRTLRPYAPGLIRELRPGGRGAGVAISGLLPPGRFPTWRLGTVVDEFAGTSNGAWPENLWIPATRVTDLSTVVFGRDDRSITVGEAIEASSALPGVMEPKLLDGRHFIDGGAVSPTHADLAAGVDAGVVVVSSPMSRRGPRPLGLMARRRLRHELDRLHVAGKRTIVIEPPPGADGLFRAYPRRDRSAGRRLVALGERLTIEAIAAANLRSAS